MYGGDEVSALVLDLGSDTVKAGNAGEDTPKCVLPSAVGIVEGGGGGGATTRNGGSNNNNGGDVEMKDAAEGDKDKKSDGRQIFMGSAMGFRRDGMEVKSVVEEGLVEDWDLAAELWNHVFRDQLKADPQEHPVLLAEQPYVSKAHREKAVEMLFEMSKVPAVYLAKTAVLAAFASAKATALIVDCGGGGTCVTGVHEGYALNQSIIRSRVSGDMLTEAMWKVLEKQGHEVKPLYSFKKKAKGGSSGEFDIVDTNFPKTTASYRRYCQLSIVRDCKESVCRVSEVAYDEAAMQNVPTISYELPDGRTIEVGTERFRVPEVLFNPALLSTYKLNNGKIASGKEKGGEKNNTTTTAAAAENTTASYSGLSLPAMVLESVARCDVDVRKDLLNAVVLSGGNSVLPNMRERLERELLETGPQSSKIKVMTQQANLERRFSSWIGGSILGSLGSFQQMWLSKAEYDEHGAHFIHRKAP